MADPPDCHIDRVSTYEIETRVSRYGDGDYCAKSILAVAWHPACDVPIDVASRLGGREVDVFLAAANDTRCTMYDHDSSRYVPYPSCAVVFWPKAFRANLVWDERALFLPIDQ